MSENMPNPSGSKRRFEGDLDFHNAKWEEKARRHANRGPVERWWSKDNTSKDAGDVMREEAERDNDDFDKKRKKNTEGISEYEELEKDGKVARANFLERARHPERTDIKTLVIFMHGGMKAADIAGSALALYMMGINSETVDDTIGGSSGKVVADSFVGGLDSLLRGIAMLIGPLATKRFIDVLRLGNGIDLSYIKELQDNGEFELDVPAIQKAHSGLWTLVTRKTKDGEKVKGELLNTKEIQEGISTSTVSTMSIPGVTGKIPTIDGVTYLDAGFADLPLEEIIEKFRPEDPNSSLNILIFSQSSFESLEDIKVSTAEEVAATIMRTAAIAPQGLGSIGTADTIKKLADGLVLKQKDRETRESIQREQKDENQNVHISLITAPPNELSMTSIDSLEMESAVLDSFRRTFDLFDVEQPEAMPRYISQFEKERLAKAIERHESRKAA